MRTNLFDRISFLSLFLVIVLLPVFFIPFTSIPIETSKGLLLVVGLAVSVVCWGLARFFDGKISVDRSGTLLAGGGVVFAFLLSAFFLKDSQVSFFGTMFDVGTFWFIFCAFLLMFMSSIILGDPKKAKIVLFGAILSGAVLLVFQSLRLFLPEILSLGVLASKTDNLLGSWNALGLFSGFSSLMSLLIVEFFPTSQTERRLLQILTILGVLVVAVVNFPLAWTLLGISALIIFVYKISIATKEQTAEGAVVGDGVSTEDRKTRFPVFSFIIILLTLLFFISGDYIGGYLPSRLGVQSTEIGPSFSATMMVTKAVLGESPLFGIGPNKFDIAWSMYKPAAINTTPFWNVSFNSGSGLLPTFAATTGYLGILAWLLFFVLFIMAGVKSIFTSIKNGSNWETMAFFVLSFYLFVSSFFHSAGAVVFLLAFAFAGVFIGLSASMNSKGAVTLSYLNDHRKSFFSILFIVLILIASAGLSFKYIERLVSVSYFGKTLGAPTVAAAEDSISRALRLYQNDLYLRTYAQVYLLKLNSLVSKGGTPSEADQALLQPTLDEAEKGALLAIIYNSKNYLNFQALGSVYQTVIPLGVKDAYTKAIDAYTKASSLNPLNPGIKLGMASVSIATQKTKEAKDYANAALTLKSDYTDAFIILSQIAKSEGDNAGAITYAQSALATAPTNADLIKYVDSLKNPSTPAVPPPTTTKKK